MSKPDYYRAVLLGVVVGMAFLSMFYVFLSPVDSVKPAEALDAKGSFSIVDTYKGCDVVLWHYDMLAEYKYFLDCTDSMRNK